jgi:cell division protein FtsW (lipid II flippase)
MKRQTPIIILVFGTLLLLVGLLFKKMNWPDMFFGIYSGPVLILIAVILFLKNRNGKSGNS